MELEKVIKERFSCRKFSDKKIDREIIDKILEAGRVAPTAKNYQPFRVYVVESEEGIEKIDKASQCRYGAPVVLIVCGDKDNSYVKNGNPMYVMDCSIVTTHMMLEATNLGVDNIWIELFDNDIVKKEFNMEDNIEPVCLLPLGYKQEDCKPSHLHDTRKDLKDLVVYID